jgi:hypothetical protein
MHGNMSAARQNSANGHACHVDATERAAPLVRGDPHAGQPSTAVRIPPFVASRDNSWIRQWPLRSFLELGAFPGAVPCARLYARQMLWEWRLTGLSDIAELLISELVTNAVQISNEIARDYQPPTVQRCPMAGAIGTAGRLRADARPRQCRSIAVPAGAGCGRCKELGTGRPGDPTPRPIGPRPAMTPMSRCRTCTAVR